MPPIYEQPGYSPLSETDLRQLVLNNPWGVNRMDNNGYSILRVAVEKGFVKLVEWLLDNHKLSTHSHLPSPLNLLHVVKTADTMSLLLARGVDPTVITDSGMALLMGHAKADQVETIERLLQDLRVHATINATNYWTTTLASFR